MLILSALNVFTLGAVAQAGIEQGGAAGLARESAAFAEAASLDTHKGLVHIFFAQRSTKKVKGVTDVPGQCSVSRRSSICFLFHFPKNRHYLSSTAQRPIFLHSLDVVLHVQV